MCSVSVWVLGVSLFAPGRAQSRAPGWPFPLVACSGTGCLLTGKWLLPDNWASRLPALGWLAACLLMLTEIGVRCCCCSFLLQGLTWGTISMPVTVEHSFRWVCVKRRPTSRYFRPGAFARRNDQQWWCSSLCPDASLGPINAARITPPYTCIRCDSLPLI